MRDILFGILTSRILAQAPWIRDEIVMSQMMQLQQASHEEARDASTTMSSKTELKHVFQPGSIRILCMDISHCMA